MAVYIFHGKSKKIDASRAKLNAIQRVSSTQNREAVLPIQDLWLHPADDRVKADLTQREGKAYERKIGCLIGNSTRPSRVIKDGWVQELTLSLRVRADYCRFNCSFCSEEASNLAVLRRGMLS